jgi:hypothetical protein
MDTEAILARSKRAFVKQQAFASMMKECYRLAMPDRDGWNSYGYGGERAVQNWDSTAAVATSRFANRFQQALFPSQQRWASLDLPPELTTDNEAQLVARDLEKATDLTFRHIHVSNFDTVINECSYDLAAGVFCLLLENGRLGGRPNAPLLRFQAVPSAQVAFDEGPFGLVEGVFFRQVLPARLVARTYPDIKAMPPALAKAETEAPEQDVPLLQATYYDPKAARWKFCVFHGEGGDAARLVERTYRTNPWIIARWSKAPGETHGRGPLTQALPDIRVLNKLMELALKSGSYAVAGVFTAVDDGVLNPGTVRLQPGAIIPVRSNGGPMGESLKPLTMPSRFDINEALRNEMKTTIRQVLFDDPLPPEIQAGITATEVVERVRRFQADTGAFGRLQVDAVTPLVVRCVDILEEAGVYAKAGIGKLLEAMQNDLVRVVATSPLSQAQDRADLQAVISAVQTFAALGEAGMAMMADAMDPTRTAVFIAERSGVPKVLIPTDKEREARQAAANNNAQQQQLLTSPVVAQVAGAVAGGAMRPPAEAA